MKRICMIFIIGLFLCNTFSVNAISFATPVNKPQRNICLMYHRLSVNPADWGAFCTSPAVFENDLKILKQEGYTFCTAAELAEFARKNDFTKKRVAITFDDGYSSDYIYALPALQRQGAKASFFIIGNRLNTPDYLSDEQLKKLAASPITEIGNHSFALHDSGYYNLRNMYYHSKNEKKILSDFSKNKELLESLTGQKIISLSYPNGVYSEAMDKQIKKVYQNTVCTREEDITKTQKCMGRYNRYHSGEILKIIKN
uniref:NodB homology domain-containing protein n=1 Tax=uncultured Bacillota bacterium TaxID=344338 RepID=A0A650EQI6_9FIRM|nr:hypothetical protein Firmicute1046_2900 [uncultured Firmicutes bacterium]